MSGEGFSGLFGYLGWAFLPNFATNLIQTFFYRITIRSGTRIPQPGQPLHTYHRRRIHILVLSLYLLYTLVQTLYDIRLAGDFYTVLGVSPDSPDREIKAKFRRLAARFHPDKVRPGNDDAVDVEAAFLHLKLAHDTLLEPAKRFAYDRFGPAIVRVQQPGLKTIRDYVYAGLRSLIPEYAKGGFMLVVLNYFWLPRWGQFWRYLAILTLAFLELYFLTHEWHPSEFVSSGAAGISFFLPGLFPHHLLPFQILALARRMSISLNIFISQLAPSAASGASSIAVQDQRIQAQTAQLTQLSHRVDAEAAELLGLGLAPFRGDAELVRELRREMKEVMVTNRIRGHPDVKKAVANALERRETGNH